MKIVTGKEMKQIDKIAVEDYSISSAILMERAGLAVYEEIITKINASNNKNVALFCGKGNNGGDGFVIARHLCNRGINVKVFLLTEINEIKGDAKLNLSILEKFEVSIHVVKSIDDIKIVHKAIVYSEIIVDAIFGTGFRGKISSLTTKVIETINMSRKYIFSVDIPSGTLADDGSVSNTVVNANKTISFQLNKVGNILFPACAYNGEVIVKDIGIPHNIIEQFPSKKYLITDRVVNRIIPKRKANTHKGDYGKALIIAGSLGMTGAAVLVASAAMRSGIGIARLLIPESLNDILETKLTETITIPAKEKKRGYISKEETDNIFMLMKKSSVVAIGSGCGNSEDLTCIVAEIIKKSNIAVIIDADGLNALSKKLDVLKEANTQIILTPHVMEFSILTGISIDTIKNDMINIASDFAQKWGAILILKSSVTIVATPTGEIYVNKTGNPGMASAGTGDVLTGIVTALIGQGINPVDSAIAAVYILGKSGEEAAKTKGEYGLIASDIIEAIPVAFVRSNISTNHISTSSLKPNCNFVI